ncbi:MAG: putative metal-binding motif-containing protein [Myxococcota bacterium]
MSTRIFCLLALLVGCDPTDDKDTDTGTAAPIDADGDGFTADEDCDDANAAVNPDAAEVCDGLDNDCDTEIDGPDATDAQVQYPDVDQDGYGDPGLPLSDCVLLSGYVANNTDCDDTDAGVSPGSPEVCDGDDVDEDCDGLSDDEDDSVDTSTQQTTYSDADGDGYGDADAAVQRCDLSSGYVLDATDCDDTNPAAHEFSMVTDTVIASETVTIAYNNGVVFRDDVVRAYTYGKTGGNDDLVGWSLFSLPTIEGALAEMILYVNATTVTSAPMVHTVRSADDGWTRNIVGSSDIARDEVVSINKSSITSGWNSFLLDLTGWDITEDIADGAITLGVDNSNESYSYAYFSGADSIEAPYLEVTYEVCN